MTKQSDQIRPKEEGTEKQIAQELKITEQSWDEKHAEGWCGEYRQPHGKLMKSIRKQLENGELPEDGRILDIGCGSGRHLLPLVSRGFDLIGMDISSIALERVRQCLENDQSARLIQGEASNLSDIEDSSIDLVLALGVIHHNRWQGIQESIAEIARVLKLGKHLLFGDRFIHDMAKRKVDIGDHGYTARDVDGSKIGVIQHYFTVEEIEQLAEEHGFDIVAGPRFGFATREGNIIPHKSRFHVDYRKRD